MSTEKFSHWWWQGKSVEKLVKKLLAAGKNPRLEVYMTEDAGLAFRVKNTDSETAVLDDDDPINESHRCPPFC